MDKNDVISKAGAARAAELDDRTAPSHKAEAVEQAMSAALDRAVVKPWFCDVGQAAERIKSGDARPASVVQGAADGTRRFLIGDDPRLPKMPAKPTLVDFFRLRFAPAAHLLQSARLAKLNGSEEKVIFACLLHDISNAALMRSDHGYWGAQLIEPYVPEEVSWSVRHHQALRFFPDEAAGYPYPEAYVRFFGEDYQPEPYIVEAYEHALEHEWYMAARLITVNDIYAFDPDVVVSIDEFEDLIGRHFKQPPEGLGFDNSPVAHMWRTVIWPNNFL